MSLFQSYIWSDRINLNMRLLQSNMLMMVPIYLNHFNHLLTNKYSLDRYLIPPAMNAKIQDTLGANAKLSWVQTNCFVRVSFDEIMFWSFWVERELIEYWMKLGVSHVSFKICSEPTKKLIYASGNGHIDELTTLLGAHSDSINVTEVSKYIPLMTSNLWGCWRKEMASIDWKGV